MLLFRCRVCITYFWFETITGYFEKMVADGLQGQKSLSATLEEKGDGLGVDYVSAAWVVGVSFATAQDTRPCTSSCWQCCYTRRQPNPFVVDRPPTFSDEEKLPQIEAMVKEVLRCRLPLPMGAPHASAEAFLAMLKYGIRRPTSSGNT